MTTRERLQELFYYNPETGEFIWKATGRGRKGGAIAGRRTDCRKIVISVDGQRYPAHRLAWLYHFGAWPSGMVDHINCNPLDNRIVNLREATRSQNAANQQRDANAAGFKGVDVKRGLYRARITIGGRCVDLGRFSSAEAAAEAYLVAARAAFGEYARP